MRTLVALLGSLLVWSCGTATETAASVPQPNPCSASCKPDGGTDCSCFFNSDCNTGYRCGPEGSGTCECGARGTGKLNDACTGPNSCESSVCMEAKDGKTYCTIPCDPSRIDQCTGLLNLCNGALVGGLCSDR